MLLTRVQKQIDHYKHIDATYQQANEGTKVTFFKPTNKVARYQGQSNNDCRGVWGLGFRVIL